MPYAPETTFSPRRLTVIAWVVLLHVGLFAGLKTGLARQVVAMVHAPIEVRIIQEEIVAQEEPPPPPVKMETVPPFVPMPEIDIRLPAPSPITAIASVVSASEPPPMVITAVAAVSKGRHISRTGMKLDPNRSPSPDEYYPPISKRMNEEGSSTVGVCVGPDGRVIGPAKLDRTSGSPRLDEAALKYVVRTRWTPATENGRSVQACTSLAVRFVLKEG